MQELLKLCGHERDEAEAQLPRITKAFRILGINAADIERGKQRLTDYYAVELKGIRKLLRLYVKEMVNLVLAREEGRSKIFYGFMASFFSPLASAAFLKSKEVYALVPAQLFEIVLGAIFGKLDPVLEAAETKWVKAGAVSHCGNVKTMVGSFVLGLVPEPDLQVTSGMMCETAPKNVELLQQVYGFPTFSYDGCEDREYAEYPDAGRFSRLVEKSMRQLVARMEEIAGVEITDDVLSEALSAREALGSVSLKLQELVENSDPLVIAACNDILWYAVDTVLPGDDCLDDAVAALTILYGELQERVGAGVGVVEKGAPRLLAVQPPHFSDPRLEHLVGELGLALVVQEGSLYPPDGSRIYKGAQSENPYQALCARYLQSSMRQGLATRIPIILGACRRLGIAGVINRYHVPCRTLAADAVLLGKAIREELGIPVLQLEWEGFDPRIYDDEQYSKKLKLFKTLL